MLRAGQTCARCVPRVDGAAAAAGEGARPMEEWVEAAMRKALSARKEAGGGGAAEAVPRSRGNRQVRPPRGEMGFEGGK